MKKEIKDKNGHVYKSGDLAWNNEHKDVLCMILSDSAGFEEWEKYYIKMKRPIPSHVPCYVSDGAIRVFLVGGPRIEAWLRQSASRARYVVFNCLQIVPA